MSDDELELKILERFVARFDEAEAADPQRTNKCARELDIREVLSDLTGKTGPALNSDARRWLTLLAPGQHDRGPLRLCSQSPERQAAHQYNARAFLDPNSTGTNAWNRIRALRKEVGLPEATRANAMAKDICIFISHASDDRELASRLVVLFRAALNLPSSTIRCTSVDGHRLEGGADTDEVIRGEIARATAFVGVLSDRSMRSKYVLIELGARWGLNKHLLPLLAPGTPASVIGGPLAGKNALQADSAAQLHQMVDELGHILSVTPEPPQAYVRQLQDVKEWKPPAQTSHSSEERSNPSPEIGGTERDSWIRIAASLNSSAIELLKAAAVDSSATIVRTRTHNLGTSIGTNGRNFVEAGNPRSEAMWEGALRELELRGLVTARGFKRELFSLTDQGFRVADLIVLTPES